jgi:hypothetical protein
MIASSSLQVTTVVVMTLEAGRSREAGPLAASVFDDITFGNNAFDVIRCIGHQNGTDPFFQPGWSKYHAEASPRAP